MGGERRNFLYIRVLRRSKQKAFCRHTIDGGWNAIQSYWPGIFERQILQVLPTNLYAPPASYSPYLHSSSIVHHNNGSPKFTSNSHTHIFSTSLHGIIRQQLQETLEYKLVLFSNSNFTELWFFFFLYSSGVQIRFTHKS